MLSVLDLAEQDTSLVRESYKSRMGPCPNYFRGKCSSSTDGFVVKLDADTGKWVFMCRGCWDSQETLQTDAEARAVSQFKSAGDKRGFGNDYNYLQYFRDMSAREIYAYREEQENGGSTPTPSRGRSLAHVHERENESSRWQEIAYKGILEYEAALWSPAGEAARDYLRARGLYDEEMIKAAHMGYSTAGGIPRLLFPSINDGKIATIYRRNLLPGCAHNERWCDIPGGSKSELYRADCLKAKRDTVLLESPPDALSVVQECGNEMCNIVATGGTDGARSNTNLAKLALMPLVLVAFDAEPDKGDKAAQWWLERLPNARRLRPLCKDVNDMLMDNWDVRAWIGQAMARAKAEQEVASYDSCADCDTLMSDETREFFYSEEGSCYCENCRNPQTFLPWPAPTSTSQVSHSEIMASFKATLPGWTVEQLPTGDTFEVLVAQARAASDPVAQHKSAMMADLIAFEQEIAKPAPPTKYEKDQMKKGVWSAEDMLREATDNIDWIKRRPEKLWTMSADWIFGRWERLERLGLMLQTGITTQDVQASLQMCVNAAQHDHLVLAWSWLRPGTHEYIQRVKRIGLAGVKAEQQFFMEGGDVAGRHYCMLCFTGVAEAAQRIECKVEEEIIR